MSSANRAMGIRLDQGDNDRKALWARIEKNDADARVREGDVLKAIADNRQRNSDWQEKTSSAIAEIKTMLISSRQQGRAD
jgi:hypothetical protein